MERRDVVAIGGSLGSVSAVRRLCSELPRDLGAKICVVVHVGSRGNNLLAGIFNENSPLSITTAVDGDRLEQGHVYIAPADHHLLVIDDVVRLGRGPRENMSRPAIDPLFRSVGMSYGSRTIAVLLTGLLDDGAAGLADVKRCGGITVVQDPGDAEAPDMPLNALRATEVDYRAPLSEMATLIMRLTKQEAGTPSRVVPDQLRVEVDIALGLQANSQAMAAIATPVPLSCPACGGVLSQRNQSRPLRFRCQVGHAYTAEALAGAHESSIDEAMHVALRIMSERAVLMDKMAGDAQHMRQLAAASTYARRADQIRASIEVLRNTSLTVTEASN